MTEMVTVPYPKAMEAFPTLRQSILASFDRCALSTKFDLDHRKGWSGHPQARGTIFHAFAAECLRAMSAMGEEQIPTDLAVEILQEQLRQADADTECVECKAPLVRRDGYRVVCENGHAHTGDYMNIPMSEIKDLRWTVVKWSHDNRFDIGNLVDIETRIEESLRYPNGEGGWVERRMTGQLDALFVTGDDDEKAIVLDWKDTWALPGPTDVGFDGYFQQRFYAWLVLRRYPSIETVTLKEVYVRFSEPRTATVHRYELEDIEAELAALAERFDRCYEEQYFPPAPGRHCAFCPRPEACPIFPSARGEGAITSGEQAIRYAQEAAVAEAVLEQRKKAMKAWSAAHGNIPISSHKGPLVWGYKARKRVSRPNKEAMEEAVRLNGGHPLSQSQLDAMYKEAQSTVFARFTPEEDDVAIEDEGALMAALEQSVAQTKAKKHLPPAGETA